MKKPVIQSVDFAEEWIVPRYAIDMYQLLAISLGFSFSFKVIIKKKTINQKRWRIKPMMNDYGCGKGGLDNSGYKEIRPIYGNK